LTIEKKEYIIREWVCNIFYVWTEVLKRMGFAGYEYTYKLNISHSFDMSGEGNGKHQHTISIKIYIRNDEIKEQIGEFKTYDSLENDIKKFFSEYQGVYINDVPPFNSVVPTIEAMGEYFFEKLNESFEVAHYKIYKMEISEIPSRVYVITDFLLTGEVGLDSLKREMNVARFIDQTAKYLNFYIDYAEHFKFSDEELIENAENVKSQENADDNSNEVMDGGSDDMVVEKETADESVTKCSETEDSRCRFKLWQYIVFACIASVATGVGMLLLFTFTGSYPMGKEVYEHLALSDYLNGQISVGNYFPAVFENWYNGYPMFAITSPFAYYILAFLQFVTGDAITSYIAFVAVFSAIGCFGWFLNGIYAKRYWAGMILGMVWMFLPANFSFVTAEGRLPYIIIVSFIPYIVYCLRKILETGHIRHYVLFVIFNIVILMTDVFPAMLTMFAVAVLAIAMGLSYRRFIRTAITIGTYLISIAATLVWLVPAYMSGLSETFAIQIDNSNMVCNIVLIAMAVVCIFVSTHQTKYACLISIVFGCAGLLSRGEFVDTVPMAKYLFSGFYMTIAGAGLCLGLLEWKRAKKYIMAVAAFFIVICCVPQVVNDIEVLENDESLYLSEVEVIRDNGIEAAVNNTDKSLYIANFEDDEIFPAFYASSNDINVAFEYNLEKRNPDIQQYVNQINYSLYCSHYSYIFDRAIEGLYDTVAISRADIMQSTKEEYVELSLEEASLQFEEDRYEDFYYSWIAEDEEDRYVESDFAKIVYEAGDAGLTYNDEYKNMVVVRAELDWERDLAELTAKLMNYANYYDYNLIIDTADYYVFKNNKVSVATGVETDYRGLAIGKNSEMIARMYPYFEEGDSISLDDYSIETLKEYDKILLLGVRFENLEAAENKISELADAGVQVYVDMSDIQPDTYSGQRTFMGVTAQDVHFDVGYEYLIYKDEIYETTKFDNLEDSIDTAYIEGIESVDGYSWLGGEKLTFNGAVNNVSFLAFDLIYYTVELQDEGAEKVLDDILGLTAGQNPERKLIVAD